jgi:hypothetical protein
MEKVPTPQRLLVRPLRAANEGLQGYLLRLAEANGLVGSKQLWSGRPPSADLILERMGKDHCSEHGHVLAPVLSQFSPEKGSRPLWNRHYSRYCPECLEELERWKWEWELTLVTSCPTHKVRLVDVCKACSKKLDWRRKSLAKCNCGAPLPSRTADKANKHEVDLSKLFSEKLNGRDGDLEHLHMLSLVQLHKLSFMLGAYAVNGGKKFSQKIGNLGDLDTALPLVDASSEILMSWPSAFFRLLGSLKRSGEIDVHDNRLSKRFGFFYRYIYRELTDPAFAFVHQGFEAYISRTWRGSLAERNSRFSQDLRRRHVWVPINSIAKELKTTSRQLQLLIDKGLIDASVTITKTGRTVTCISRENIGSIRSSLHNVVDLKNACAILGLKKDRMVQLLHGKIIGTIFQPRNSKTSRWGIPREMVEGVLSLAHNLPIASVAENSELVSLGFALRYWLREPFLFPALMAAVFLNEIFPVAIGEEKGKPSTWLFERSQLRAWMQEKRRSHRKELFSIPEVARKIGIRQQAIYHLVYTGRISWTTHPDLSHPLVSEKSLLDFSNRYMLCSEIKEIYGWLPSYTARRLKELSIAPISGAGIDGGYVYLYERSAALDNALQSIARDCELRREQRQRKN